MTAIQFLGAAGTVTGSRHLVEHRGKRVLLDCGLFQGIKELRLRNWEPFPVDVQSIDAIVLSHAHIDHSGFLPRVYKDGYRGTVWCTSATRDLLAIMLPDSGRLHEEEASYANKKGSSRHKPALPLYTEEDARACLSLLRPVAYDTPTQIVPDVTLRMVRAGHILGSASVNLDLVRAGGGVHRFTFSGDLGRYDMPIITDPAPAPEAHTLLVESTYANKSHQETDPKVALRDEVLRTVREKGVLLIPAFAIGRTQDLLYHLRQLQLRKEIPALPMFVDSPMASDATPLYLRHREEHDEHMQAHLENGDRPLNPEHVSFVQSRQDSKTLNEKKGPAIIISASGMATGGRVIHHLMRRLPDPSTTVLFVGYQAEGTRGRRLLNGEPSVRMFGEDVQVRARIARIEGFSAHADAAEVDRWLGSVHTPPTRTFCVHGEPAALAAARERLSARGWNALVPAHGERVVLD
ncbi:MAG: MBL fold metallo-hydrolase [Deltaproteobacteria bacterium]|nr:MBL fold metallo-hydrolase [Deltaproteobacteria bacterium]